MSSVFHAPIPNDVGGASGIDLKYHHQLRSGTGGSGGAQPLMEAMSQDTIDDRARWLSIFSNMPTWTRMEKSLFMSLKNGLF